MTGSQSRERPGGDGPVVGLLGAPGGTPSGQAGRVSAPEDRLRLARRRSALDDLGRLLLTEHTASSMLRRVVDLAAQAMPAGTGGVDHAGAR